MGMRMEMTFREWDGIEMSLLPKIPVLLLTSSGSLTGQLAVSAQQLRLQ